MSRQSNGLTSDESLDGLGVFQENKLARKWNRKAASRATPSNGFKGEGCRRLLLRVCRRGRRLASSDIASFSML